MIAGAIHVWKDKDFLAAKSIYHLLAEISIGRGPTFRQTSVYPRLKSKHCYFIICFQETKSRVIYNSNHLIIQSNNVTPRVLLHTKNQIFIKSSKLPSLRSTPPKKKAGKKKAPPETPGATHHRNHRWFLGEGLDPTTLVRPRTEMSSSSKRWFSRCRAAWLGWEWLDFSPTNRI